MDFVATMLVRVNFVQAVTDFCKSSYLWLLVDVLFAIFITKVRLSKESNSEIFPKQTFSRVHHLDDFVVGTTQDFIR